MASAKKEDRTEAKRAYARTWYAKNREKVKAAVREFVATNRDKVAARRRSLRAINRDHVNATKRRLAMENKKRWDADRKNAERLKATEKARNWRVNNRDKVNAIAKRWRDKHRKGELEQFYGLIEALRAHDLTLDQYHALQERQNFQCAICLTDEPSKSKRFKRFAIDHCHDSKRVRGLLCGSCNTAIGLLKNNPALCRNASDYLST